tara:strand:- start:1546 stop:1902 length:357 start_codon:yes stop_codon:yes gene_type:complete
MDEQTQTEAKENQPQTPDENSKGGEPQSPTETGKGNGNQTEQRETLVDQARVQAENLKTQNERMEENIKKLEELQSEAVLGGRSVGSGTNTPEPLSPIEYSKALERGEVNPLLEDGYL